MNSMLSTLIRNALYGMTVFHPSNLRPVRIMKVEITPGVTDQGLDDPRSLMIQVTEAIYTDKIRTPFYLTIDTQFKTL
jgi:hypothetical protein